MSARAATMILGLWLFVSAFLWPHGASHFSNTWIVGLLAVAFALIAMAFPFARYLNTALALWLFVSVWVLPGVTTATAWNNALVAVALFALSLVSGGEVSGFGRRPVRGTP
jgi:hypothetical protein